MSEEQNPTKKFIKHLLSLESKQDRGALADLRSGASYPLGQAPKMHKHIVPSLEGTNRDDAKWYYAVGVLYGIHPLPYRKNNIGNAFNTIWDKKEGSSIEKRFLVLLDSHPDDLFNHLQQAFRLFKTKDVDVNYYTLIEDLCQWDWQDKPVQQKWAREFYKNMEQGEE